MSFLIILSLNHNFRIGSPPPTMPPTPIHVSTPPHYVSQCEMALHIHRKHYETKTKRRRQIETNALCCDIHPDSMEVLSQVGGPQMAVKRVKRKDCNPIPINISSRESQPIQSLGLAGLWSHNRAHIYLTQSNHFLRAFGFLLS